MNAINPSLFDINAFLILKRYFIFRQDETIYFVTETQNSIVNHKNDN